MQRSLQPELLDFLSPGDPRARRSRRDLRMINRLLGNDAWWRQTLRPTLRPGEHILELGAAESTLYRNLPGCLIDGLDRCPPPAHWPHSARWHQVDVKDFAEWERYRAIIANLTFHHFCESTLLQIGAHIRRHARVVIACEPLRRRRFQRLFPLLCGLISAGDVTRHDGHVSIAAGFRDDELPYWLGLSNDEWVWRVQESFAGAYRMVAERRE